LEKHNFSIRSADYNGNDISITCEGIDDEKLAHFGGLDLYLKAARVLIASTQSPMSFPEKNGDYNIRRKVVGLLINEIGELIRNSSPDEEYLTGYSNIELVEEYLQELKNDTNLKEIIEQDESLIRKYKEDLWEEEKEIWDRIDEEIKNK